MLIQIPVFFSLYKVLFVTIEMRHAPFYGWIQRSVGARSDLDLQSVRPAALQSARAAGFLASFRSASGRSCIGITQWVQTKLNPPPADPVQAKMFAFMPLIFTFMFATFPAGLVIYYAWNNLLSIAQQIVHHEARRAPIDFFDRFEA